MALGEDLVTVERVGGVAGDTGPHRVDDAAFAQMAPDPLDGPDGTVLGGVLQDQGIAAVVETTGGIGLPQGPTQRVGDQGAVGRPAVGVGRALHDVEKHQRNRPQPPAGRGDPRLEGYIEIRLAE